MWALLHAVDVVILPYLITDYEDSKIHEGLCYITFRDPNVQLVKIYYPGPGDRRMAAAMGEGWGHPTFASPTGSRSATYNPCIMEEPPIMSTTMVVKMVEPMGRYWDCE